MSAFSIRNSPLDIVTIVAGYQKDILVARSLDYQDFPKKDIRKKVGPN
jgi:hypothetical protein